MSAVFSSDTGKGGRRRLVLAVFLLALAVRVVYVAQIRDSPFFESPVIDALTYHERALALAQGVWHEEEVFWQPPLYPYLLGALYKVLGPKIAVARSVQLLLGAAICALVALLAGRLHGRIAGWTAGITLALCGTMIFFEGELLNPVLSIALNTGAVLLLIPRAPDALSGAGNLSDFGRLPLGRWLGAGLLLGLSAISRPDILVFAGVIALAPLLAPVRARRAPGVAHWLRLLAFAGAVLVPIVPVTAHNVVFGGEWVPISSNAGLNFYLGNSGEYDRTVGVRPGLHWEQLMLEPLRAGVAEDDAGGASAWWARRGLRAIGDAPGRWLSDLAHKAGLGVAAAESGRNLELSFFSRYAPLLAWLPGWGVIFPLGVAGAFLAWRRRRDGALLVLLGCYGLTLMVFFVSARYRLPMIPVFAIFAGFAVDRAWLWWNEGRRASTLVLAVAVLLIGVAVRSDRVGAGPPAAESEADGHYLVAKALANRGQHAAAAGFLEEALAVAPNHWDAVFDLAAAWTNLGQLPRAVPLYERILARHPEDRESLLALTDALLRLGRKREALERLSASASDSRATADLVFTICGKLFSLGENEEAVRVGRQAEGRDVMDSHLEELIEKMTRANLARRRLAACLEESPVPAAMPPSLTVRAELVRARDLLQQGEHLDAELVVAGAVISASSASPASSAGSAWPASPASEPTGCHDDPAAWNLLGKLWFLQQSPLAPNALRRATRLDPELAEAHLGLAHSLAADPEARAEAAAALERFLELSPQGAEAERARRALSSLAARQEEDETPP